MEDSKDDHLLVHLLATSWQSPRYFFHFRDTIADVAVNTLTVIAKHAKPQKGEIEKTFKWEN